MFHFFSEVGMKELDLLDDNSSLSESIDSVLSNRRGLFVLKLPVDNYYEMNLLTIKYLLEQGFKGVYVSFQRPVENIRYWLEKFGIDVNDTVVLDGTGEEASKDYADNVLPKDRKKIFDKILVSLEKLQCDKKFVLIDSLTTMALINSNTWSHSFSKLLISSREHSGFKDVVFLVNVAKDLFKKEIVKGISSHADGVFNISSYPENYSADVVKPEVLT